jgi:hypothetical protein
MKRLVLLLLLCLGASGCERARDDDHRASFALRADMSDEDLLRAMKRDPTKMKRQSTDGVDGSSIAYSDAEEEVVITRSVVTGVAIVRHIKPRHVWQTWHLGNP